MSESENKKVQDILREVADGFGTFNNICNAVSELREALGIEETSSWVFDLDSCLREIADRVDRQSVVEVQVPMPSDPFARITELYPMTRAEAISAIERWLASRDVAPQSEPTTEPRKVGTVAVGVEVDTSQIDEAIEKLHELGPMTPNVYLNDCVVKVYVDGVTDDQD